MAEAVRLLIWDLDETFWNGTLTEGGIKSIPEANIAIVRALNRRGIMNSICSKNDKSLVIDVLDRVGLKDEFIFPSINWSAKGSRVQEIINKVNLRPETIMFIDDNPGVRAEVAATVPGIQIEDETFIGRILSDERFAGKADSDLTRLKQYKVMETKELDQNSSNMSNEDFLRQSDIRLKIDYDLDHHTDRILELVMRTNQLNFTKRRLPENREEAVAILTSQLSQYNIQAGLVSVVDKYGDYGAVGFFMQSSVHELSADGSSRGELIHFCFSCRTLGMLVEQWVYKYLGSPKLTVVGHVLTDLAVDRHIDWITLVESFDIAPRSTEALFPKIVLFGGCEANAIAVYLQAMAKDLNCYGNYQANGCFVRTASAVHAINMCDTDRDAVRETAARLQLPVSRLADDIFKFAPEGSVFIFNCSSGDAAGSAHFRHRSNGLTLNIEPPFMAGLHFMTSEKQAILDHIPEDHDALRSHVANVYDYLHEEFELIHGMPEAKLSDLVRRLIERVPPGGKIIFMSDHDHIRMSDTEIIFVPWFAEYAKGVRKISEDYDFCGFMSFAEILTGNDEIQLHGNHYNREVYLRAASRLREIALSLRGKSHVGNRDLLEAAH